MFSSPNLLAVVAMAMVASSSAGSNSTNTTGNSTVPVSPYNAKFCNGAKIDPKKVDLCIAAQGVLLKEDTWKEALKVVEAPQKVYMDLREENVQNLTEAYSGASLAFKNFEDRTDMDIGRSYRAEIELLERAIQNTKEATEVRVPMVEFREVWQKAVFKARDEHEKYAKLLHTFDYLSKRELKQAELKVRSLKNRTKLVKKDVVEQIARAANITKEMAAYVSDPATGDVEGATALKTTRKATSRAAASKRLLLALEAELKLAKLMLKKIKFRTAGTGMPDFPDYEPAANEAEAQITSLQNSAVSVGEATAKAEAELDELKAKAAIAKGHLNDAAAADGIAASKK
jgi:hypothetical protein